MATDLHTENRAAPGVTAEENVLIGTFDVLCGGECFSMPSLSALRSIGKER